MRFENEEEGARCQEAAARRSALYRLAASLVWGEGGWEKMRPHARTADELGCELFVRFDGSCADAGGSAPGLGAAAARPQRMAVYGTLVSL